MTSLWKHFQQKPLEQQIRKVKESIETSLQEAANRAILTEQKVEEEKVNEPTMTPIEPQTTEDIDSNKEPTSSKKKNTKTKKQRKKKI
jgi:hypothetical protein